MLTGELLSILKTKKDGDLSPSSFKSAFKSTKYLTVLAFLKLLKTSAGGF
jgi:hypothetical protein